MNKLFVFLYLALGAALACPQVAGAEPVQISALAGGFKYLVEPANFGLWLEDGEQVLPVSAPGPERAVEQLEQRADRVSWVYPEESLQIFLTATAQCLEVRIACLAQDEQDFVWPRILGQNYSLPLGQGKYFSARDPVWLDYLDGQSLDAIEQLSMAFAAASFDDTALVYVLPENWNNYLDFRAGANGLELNLRHDFVAANPDRNYYLRIYACTDNPVAIAGVYRQFVEAQDDILSLADKEAANPNIAALYGAAHFYLFDSSVISETDIKWQSFRQSLAQPVFARLRALAPRLEDSASFLAVLDELPGQDYVSLYQRQVICRALSEMLRLEDFAEDPVFARTAPEVLPLAGLERNLNPVEQVIWNKYALATNLPGLFQPVPTWADERTVDILDSMHEAGIEKAWIGLNDWQQAFSKPELAVRAGEYGWLLAPYDSYHSVHEPGREQWNTAVFPDYAYHEFSIVDKNGSHVAGFGGVGRKINPTLALDLVRQRVGGILEAVPLFNSWFVDCDATGEVYDDYSPAHFTSRRADVLARLERLEMLGREYGMVIGSEGGHDFAANSLAFAHGLELQSFSWMDEDMRSNRQSPYYLGRYYSPVSGAPEKFVLQVPVKPEFKAIFLNPVYNIPLFKLVYNNALITGYHWDWSSLKILDEVRNRRLYELLYNVPPMFHLDKFEWEKHGAYIAEHVSVWSDWSRQIIHEQMTDFEILSPDRLVQAASYGPHRIAVNWSDQDFTHQGRLIPAKAWLIW